ncbi:type II toxin-antitoxin system VapC family toxin [Butyrivibrio sp. WCE2006]|uniref:type II toxin-antitoxin system VapC family toxin n=1 Tax=Butyrivibrio sp. WCE2006 TaxID=1410611 RepID=UPI0005D26984|nr:PIN domain-containing protein [Butyrivibrio sp. WCE2006]
MTGIKTYFDTAIFIYALELKMKEARDLFTDALQQGTVGTSAITIMEYTTGCFKNGTKEDIDKFNKFLTDLMFEVKNVDREVAVEAARIRAEYPSFKQMDSLQIASANVAGADIFYTNDKQLLQFKDDGMKVIKLETISV